MRNFIVLVAGVLLGVVMILARPSAAARPASSHAARPCADHQAALLQAGSSTTPFTVVTCGFLKAPGVGKQWLIVNDGADNDFDASDVLLGFPVPAPTSVPSGQAGAR